MSPRQQRRKTFHSRSFFAGCAAALAIAASVAVSGEVTVSAQAAPIAFAARGKDHFSKGPPAVVTYNSTVTNQGGHWNGSTTFTAPQSGVYFFSVQFVKDTYYPAPPGHPLAGEHGTKKDVYVSLSVTPSSVVPPGPYRAWAGKDAGGDRATGAMSTVLELPAGATVTTKASSGFPAPTRHVIQVYFSGFLIE